MKETFYVILLENGKFYHPAYVDGVILYPSQEMADFVKSRMEAKPREKARVLPCTVNIEELFP